MKISQAVKMAFSSLAGNKMRSFLTMLGMIIGVSAVIAMMSIMDGMIGYTMDSFGGMGASQITVNLTSQTDTRQLSDDEVYKFLEENPDYFVEVSPCVTMMQSLRNEHESLDNKSVSGVSEAYAAMEEDEIGEGRFLSYLDVEKRNKVCVIGTYIADQLYNDVGVLGSNLKIGSDTYKIVGIMEEQEDSEENSADDCVYIPYTTAARASGNARISTYYFQMKSTDASDASQDVLENFLYSVFHDSDMYTVINMASLLDMMDDMVGMMENILVGIAAISLLVAGIGIMNIMLVSVSERTREIGIRKSLGAKKRDIRYQFAIEAATVSTLGGIIGILLGGLLTTVLGNLVGIDCSPSMSAIGISFGVSAGIGLLFGFLPANKAANLNPIDALRNE